MMFESSRINLCIFCYKTTSPQNRQYVNQNEKCGVQKFLRLLGRFLNNDKGEINLAFLGGLQSCRDCDILISDFVEVYHKIKCLELELLLKLENLGNVMTLAESVPSRVKTMRQCFENSTKENPNENQVFPDEFKSFQSWRRKLKSKYVRKQQPRVLLKRIDDDNNRSRKAQEDFESTENSNVEIFSDENVNLEAGCLIGENDNTDLLANNFDEEKAGLLVEMKFNTSPTNALTNPVQNQISKNTNTKKFKRKQQNTVQQRRYHCALCKTSYLSLGGLRKHKNNAFHRFLKQKTLKVCVNFAGNSKNCYSDNDKASSQTLNENKAGNTMEIKEKFTKKRYNLRDTNKKSNVTSPDDEIQSNSEFPIKQDISSSSSTSSSSSDDTNTSDNDDDNADIKPKISKIPKGNLCPEPNCCERFITIIGLETHVKLHGTFPCKFCDITLAYAPDLAYHENQKHTEYLNVKQMAGSVTKKFNFKCSRCPEGFFRKSSYMYHFVEKHLELSTVLAICPICQHESHTESLRMHNLGFHFTDDMESSEIPRCNQCSAYFRLNSQLAHHKLKIHNETLSCISCERNFNSVSELAKHFELVHPNHPIDMIQQFKCSTCKNGYTTQGGLNRHISNVHPDKMVENKPIEKDTTRKPSRSRRYQKPSTKVIKFICSICALEVSSGQELAEHELNHQKNSKKYVHCPRCKKYLPKIQYRGHFMRNHIGAKPKLRKFECEICKNQVTQLHLHHAAFHEKDETTKIYKCEENNCKAYFIKAVQLIRHMRKVHRSGYECKYCGKKLKGRSGLMSHMKKLHPEKNEDPSLPLACDRNYCKKRFGTEAELEWHKKWDAHDSGSGEKRCKKCGKEFASKGFLNNHMKTKCVDTRSFICQICGKGFKTQGYLEQHLRFHKGPDSFEWQCQTCGKKFINKYKLKEHMTCHSGEKKWICQWCGEKYGYRRSWIKHVMQKHKDEEGLPEVRKIVGVNRISRKGARPGDFVIAGVKMS